jgi:hypothetical protein
MADDVLTGLDTPPAPSAMDKIIEARQERERLNRLEQTTVPGAETLVSKSILLDPREAREHPANKGFKLRWVNTSLPEKIQSRKLEGYEVVPDAEGGKRLGTEYVLMRIPESKANAKKAALREKGRVWLAAHKNEMERTADEVAKILQSKYGFGEKEAKILIDEA